MGFEVRQDLNLCPADSVALAVKEGPRMGISQLLQGSLAAIPLIFYLKIED